jgi:hypothetical protein
MVKIKQQVYLTSFIILLVSLISFISISTWDGNIIHIISGLLLSCFITGFTFMILIYPKNIFSIEKTVLSILISFIFDILVGTSLEILNLKLNESGFIIGLWLITVSFSIAFNFTNTDREILSFQKISNKIHQSLTKHRLMLISTPIKVNYFVRFILLSTLIIIIFWAFQINLNASKVITKPFTALTIEPSTLNNNIKIVIDNQENKFMIYRLEMRRNSILIKKWENIKLDQDVQWTIEVPLSEVVGQSELWLYLYKEDESEPYRQVHAYLY